MVDHAHNIVVFGLKEDRNVSVWRSDVDKLLQFVISHAVDVVDMFRLGRFIPNSSRSRLVLVKLRFVWDKRTILSNCDCRLKEFRQGEIFIDPDEPLEAHENTSAAEISRYGSWEMRCSLTTCFHC